MANYSIRYGASIRKRSAGVKQKKQAKYRCEACGRMSVKRIGTSIWRCTHCNATYAGGAYTMTTPEGEVARRLIDDVRKSK
jgi:large subunit ribosomal protein L37Ae